MSALAGWKAHCDIPCERARELERNEVRTFGVKIKER
jgi:hypothetical protein